MNSNLIKFVRASSYYFVIISLFVLISTLHSGLSHGNGWTQVVVSTNHLCRALVGIYDSPQLELSVSSWSFYESPLPESVEGSTTGLCRRCAQASVQYPKEC